VVQFDPTRRLDWRMNCLVCRSQFNNRRNQSDATQFQHFTAHPQHLSCLGRGCYEWSILLRLILGIKLTLKIPRKERTHGP
jgi:hypothetical protein